jgi:hypothetical protein
MPRERGDSGQFVNTVEGDDVLDVLAAVEGPVVTSADVADGLDVTRETARRNLNPLVDDGTLDRRKTAGRVVYWRASGAESTEAADGDDDLVAVVDRVAEQEGWDDPAPRLEARKDAARAVLEYAREHGGVSQQAAKEEVYPNNGVEGQSPGKWYRQNVRPVLNEAADSRSRREYVLTNDSD